MYENDPLPPQANTQEDWVCRHAHPNPSVPRPVLEAGSTTGIVYGTGAIGHVGDCAVYVSYDTERPRRTMRWVKIANLPDCRSQINENVPIVVPSQLPAGDAVLRWDQYALHQVMNVPPFIEWFLQCADVRISSSSTRSWESFNSFSIIDNDGTPAYPSSVSSYRIPYKSAQAAPGDPDFWMTGPACVDDSVNQCALTAIGTKGYTGFGGEVGTGSPASPPGTPAVRPAPMPAEPPPYNPAPAPASNPAAPVAPSAASAGDAMCCYDAGCSTYGTSFCSAMGTWCSGSAEACQSCGGTLCADPAGSYPTPSPPAVSTPPPPSPPVPSPSPPNPSPPSLAPAEAAQCCFHGGCSSYGTSFCYPAGIWCSESSEHCTSCGGIWCSGASLLSARYVRSAKFLHRPGASAHVLIQLNKTYQESAKVRRASGPGEEEL